MTVDASDTMPDWYEEYFGEEYLLLYPHRDLEDAERLVDLLCRTVDLRRGWRVLDVACGTGRHAAAFQARGARVTGLDLSKHLLLRARGISQFPVVRSDVRSVPVRRRGWFALDFLNATRVPADLVPTEDGEMDGEPVRIDRWLDSPRRHVFKSITLADGRRFVERVRLLVLLAGRVL